MGTDAVFEPVCLREIGYDVRLVLFRLLGIVGGLGASAAPHFALRGAQIRYDLLREKLIFGKYAALAGGTADE